MLLYFLCFKMLFCNTYTYLEVMYSSINLKEVLGKYSKKNVIYDIVIFS